MKKSVKVLFVQKVNDEFQTESLWCIQTGNHFVIDNIPFIAKRISLGDTILAEYDKDDQAFYFEDFVAISGNSTVRLYMETENAIPEVRIKLEKIGCESEVFLTRKIIAVNIPFNISYKPVKEYLDEGEKSGRWTYEESCLVHNHE